MNYNQQRGRGNGRFQNSHTMMEREDPSDSGKKNPLEVMQMIIKNSQKDLQQKTEQGLPTDPEALKKIFTKQQMLLELQTEMMTQMAKEGEKAPSTSADASTSSGEGRGATRPVHGGVNYNNKRGTGFDPYDNWHERREEEDMGYEMNDFRQQMPGQYGPQGGMGTRGMSRHRTGPPMEEFDPPRGMSRHRTGPPMEEFDPPRGMGRNRAGPRMEEFDPPRGMGRNRAGPPMEDFGRPRGMDRNWDGPPLGHFGPPGGMDRNRDAPHSRWSRDMDNFEPREGPPMVEREFGSQRGKRGFTYNYDDDFAEGKRKKKKAPSNPLNRPYEALPVEDRLMMLKREVFKYDNFHQALTVMESARHNCLSAHIRTIYEDLPMEDERYERYQGFLMMNGVLLGVEEGKNKVEAKVFSYAEALHLLVAKPIAYVFSNSYTLYDKAAHPTKQKRKQIDSEERLEWLHEELFAIVHGMSKFTHNRHFEELVLGLEIGITTIYKKPNKDTYSCDVYVDYLFIGSGESASKVEAYHSALKAGRHTLYTPPSKNLKFLLPETRLTNLDFHDENIVDIKHKENRHKVYTNLEDLKNKGISSKGLKDIKASIVIIVPVHKNSNLECLEMTALANEVLLEFVENSLGTCRRCIIYMNNKLIADSYSSKEISAKNMAMQRAKQVLMKRFKHLIELSDVNFEKVAMTFEQITEQALELKKSQPSLLDKEPSPSYMKAQADSTEDSPWIDAFIRSIIEVYTQTEGLDDLILSHLPPYHTQHLVDQASKLKIKVEKQLHRNISYTIIQKDITNNLTSQKFIDYLTQFDDQTSGRYKLVETRLLVPQFMHDKDN